MKQEKLRMALWAIIFLAAPLLAGHSATPQEEIDRLLTAWHRAAATSDQNAYFHMLADDAVFIGTDLAERWSKEEFRKWSAFAFKRSSAWVFRALRRDIHLSVDKKTAWFDEDLESQSFWPSRGSGVLTKIKGKWKIRQYVLSFTIPNPAVKEILPIVKKFLTDSAEGEK